MSRIGNANLEATQDDMRIGTELSDDAQHVQNIIEAARIADNNPGIDDFHIGWNLHDLDTTITSLDTMRDDLSPFKKEVAKLAAKLNTLAESL